MRHLISDNLWQINIIFDVQKRGNLSSANRTLIGLHSDYLRALNAQAHVPAGEHHGVLGGRETHHTFSLRLICDVRCRVIDTVDVVQLENRVVVLE